MRAYDLAKEAYAAVGVDTETAIRRALEIPISIHCWQSDDVGGFEVKPDAVSGGGIMATGNFPGRARNGDEVRQDIEKVLSLVPGRHRFNLHASYAETSGKAVERDAVAPEHFSRWMDWSRATGVPLDFNDTYFAHPLADSGFTLSHSDESIRMFWVRHGQACRRIAAAMADRQGEACVMNHWIPDGAKDSPADRWGPRERLVRSFDAILAEDLPGCLDAVESKLFGLGSEDYVVGSYEFYSHFALTRGVLFCLDMGHFHPTETLADKVSALLQFHRELLLHVSRPMRWDSDHVVLWNDDLRALFAEVARGNAFDRVRVALDFFDASINRIGAYVVGIRSTRKAFLSALLEPSERLKALESEGRLAAKLAWMEETKTLPFGAVWDELCERAGVCAGAGWIEDMEAYERAVLAARG